MNDDKRDALSTTVWYGLWTGSGWLRTTEMMFFWGPHAVMAAMAEDMNNSKPMSWENEPRHVEARPFPDPLGE